MKFPEINGRNLEFIKYSIPSDLKGEINLLIIPFQRWHQTLVDQWASFLNIIESKNPDFRYYELPTLTTLYKAMRFMIDGGMRAGISDKSVRARTITLYLNKTQFKKLLNIRSEETIYLFLVRRSGEILWRTEGPYDKIKAEQLVKLINDLLKPELKIFS